MIRPAGSLRLASPTGGGRPGTTGGRSGRAGTAIRAALVAGPVLLAACLPVTSDAPLRGDRGQAEQAARDYVAARDPVIDAAPVANCIARSASGEEVDALVSATDVEATVREIVRRRSTQDCFDAAGVPDFGLDLLLA